MIRLRTARLALAAAGALLAAALPAQDDTAPAAAAADAPPLELFARHCVRCHGPDEQEFDVRIDTLDPDLVAGPDAATWDVVLDMLNSGEMPPSDEPQPTDAERRRMVDWLTAALAEAAAAKRGAPDGVLRRLTRAQYTYTLQALLGVGIDFGRVLPADAKSELGFTNDGAALQASALHIETYQQIARQAVEQAIVTGPRPQPTWYRVTFGDGVGRGSVGGVTGGYQSVPLDPADFRIDILDASGRPRTGADDAERAALDAVRRRISIGLRGSSADRFQIVPEGLMLFAALPHREVAPGAWQGPSPNVKLEMKRVFPERGDLVMRVVASRGYVPPTQEQLLIALDDPVALTAVDADGALRAAAGAMVFQATQSDQRQNLRLDGDALVAEAVPEPANARLFVSFPADGFYQLDLVHPPAAPDGMPSVRVHVDGDKLDLRPQLTAADLARPRVVTPLGVVGLRRGRHTVRLGGPFFAGFSQLVVTPLPPTHPQVARLAAMADQRAAAFAATAPAIRAYVGTRTDDGMDYQTFDAPREVRAPLGAPQVFTFRGRLEDLPIPEPESGDTEELSGFMLIGLWNDHLVKRREQTGPPLLVHSIDVEAPWCASWPPPSHTAILFDSPRRDDEPAYTREVLERFLTRAFRAPVDAGVVERYLAWWRDIRPTVASYEESIREVLVAVLCSPQFLFLVEPPVGDEAAGPSQHALASRLAYFLWNGPPDAVLWDLAESGRLGDQLVAQVDRMLDDPRSRRFVRAFAHEWLRLDRLEQVTIDVGRHPAFTRFVKADMAEETYRFLEEMVAADLPVATLIDSDFAMLNQNLAEFYGIDGVDGVAFRRVPVRPEQRRGGLLSQGAFLAGHSDGSWPHPIKRAVWLKTRILGEKPPEPPPNVPDLDPDTPGFEKLTLKEQLELHRDKASCRDCHRRIDPYGIAFEGYSAVGLWEESRRGRPVDATTELPDGTPIRGIDDLKRWLGEERGDQVTRALIEHLFAWALGRTTHFTDGPELDSILARVRSEGSTMRALLRAIVASPSFSAP